MDITCPNCSKTFIVNDKLIPKRGRLVKCSNCENEWFYKNVDKDLADNTIENKSITFKDIKTKEYEFNDNENISDEIDTDTIKEDDISDDGITEDKEKKSPTLYLKYTLVIIISFISIIIILDTFKKQLSIILPNLEIILQNFYESLKDIFLFLKDLLN